MRRWHRTRLRIVLAAIGLVSAIAAGVHPSAPVQAAILAEDTAGQRHEARPIVEPAGTAERLAQQTPPTGRPPTVQSGSKPATTPPSKTPPAARPSTANQPSDPPAAAAPPVPQPPPPAAPRAEAIEVDVSTRTVAVTSAFSGTEIVVFGSVDNSRQESAESGYYDVIVVVEGASAPAIVREKTRVLGIWVNTDRVRFETLPLYRAVASTRPLEEIAEPRVLAASGVNLDRLLRGPSGSPKTLQFGAAAVRLKQRDGLYVTREFGVAFIGRTLFRAAVKLPANIPVGPLDVRVLLFKDGQVLASKAASVTLERQGLERLIYDFAYEHPFWYGMLAVSIAFGAGLLASAVFQRQTG